MPETDESITNAMRLAALARLEPILTDEERKRVVVLNAIIGGANRTCVNAMNAGNRTLAQEIHNRSEVYMLEMLDIYERATERMSDDRN